MTQFNFFPSRILYCGVLLAIPFICRAEILEVASSESTPGALATVESLNGWTVELAASEEERELKNDAGDRIKLEAEHVTLLIERSVTEWLSIGAGLGAARPEVGALSREFGVEYELHARAGLLRYELENSVVYGNTRAVAINADLSYSRSDAQLDDSDFEWSEWMLAPYALYRVDYRSPRNWNHFDPRSSTIRLGLVYSTVDGDWAGENISESRDFGYLAGGDVQLGSDMTLGLTGYIMHSDEITMELTAGYRF